MEVAASCRADSPQRKVGKTPWNDTPTLTSITELALLNFVVVVDVLK